MTADETRQSILDAAEALLGEVGFAAMSLRQLTARAGANLAGVNYHFGSKEDLVRAVLSRRIAPVNAERFRRLDALDLQHGAAAALPVAAIVDAFVGPPLELMACGGDGPCRMMGRLVAEQPPFLRGYLQEQFREVLHRFASALVRSLPGLRPADAYWRLFFTVGAMTHTMQHGAVVEALTDGACTATDFAAARRQLTAFCVAGLSADATTATAMRQTEKA